MRSVIAASAVCLAVGAGVWLAVIWAGRGRIASETPPGPVPRATEADALAVGEALVTALHSDDRGTLANLVDVEVMFNLTTEGILLPSRAANLERFRGTARDLVAQWATAVRDGGEARLLGVVDRDGPAALVRMLFVEGGVSYLALYPTTEGKIADAYMFSSGERVTASLRRSIGAMLSGAGAESSVIRKFQEAARRGDHAETLRRYERLPDSVKDLRSVQTMRVQAASLSDDPTLYGEVLADVDRRFPDEPSLDLLKIDLYSDDPPKLVATLKRLDRAVGGDPYLRGLLAERLSEVGRAEEAMAVARQAVEAEPDLGQAQIGLLSAQIATGDFPAAATQLDMLSRGFDFILTDDDLAELFPRGGEFVDSDAFRALQTPSI